MKLGKRQLSVLLAAQNNESTGQLFRVGRRRRVTHGLLYHGLIKKISSWRSAGCKPYIRWGLTAKGRQALNTGYYQPA